MMVHFCEKVWVLMYRLTQQVPGHLGTYGFMYGFSLYTCKMLHFPVNLGRV